MKLIEAVRALSESLKLPLQADGTNVEQDDTAILGVHGPKGIASKRAGEIAAMLNGLPLILSLLEKDDEELGLKAFIWTDDVKKIVDERIEAALKEPRDPLFPTKAELAAFVNAQIELQIGVHEERKHAKF